MNKFFPCRFYAFKQQSMHKRHGLRHAELNLLTPFIRFWSDNPEGSAQCGRSNNPEGRLTECRIIEVLLYKLSIFVGTCARIYGV